MQVSEGVMKWALRLYPPLFFQRIWVRRFYKGFHGVDVVIRKSIMNKNFNKAIFGGTTYAAADPFYPILFYQVLVRKGYKMNAWSRSAAIRYNKPGITDLHFTINITDEQIADCEHNLNLHGKYRKSFLIEMFDKDEKLCVSVINEIYIRNLHHETVQTLSEATEQPN
jgi:hypothetical protein